MTYPYEPAAKVADKWQKEAISPEARFFAEIIAQQIRALPNPPSDLPVFTGRDLRREFERQGDRGGLDAWDYLAQYINNSLSGLATFRPAPASEPDLERMHEAYKRALDTWNTNCNRKITERFASYLAAEGFRLGDAPSDHGWDNLSGGAWNDGYAAGRKDAAASEQSRIDAALREEREAQGDAVIRLAHVKQFCEAWIDPDRLEDGTISVAEQKTLGGIWRVAGFDAIRTRTTTPEIAGGPSTPAKEDVSCRASAVGESPAPKRKVIQVATQSAVDHVHDGYTLALADDGSLWWRGLNDPNWIELPPIPRPGETP